jgi:hypothetical protein
MVLMPTAEQAQIFAELMFAGVPPADAVVMAAGVTPDVSEDLAKAWEGDAAVREAQVALQGGDWRRLTEEQRQRVAVRKHVNELAYYLMRHNYTTAGPSERSMLKECREVLEKILAGTAGKSDGLTEFFDRFQAAALAGKKGPKVKGPEAV